VMCTRDQQFAFPENQLFQSARVTDCTNTGCPDRCRPVRSTANETSTPSAFGSFFGKGQSTIEASLCIGKLRQTTTAVEHRKQNQVLPFSVRMHAISQASLQRVRLGYCEHNIIENLLFWITLFPIHSLSLTRHNSPPEFIHNGFASFLHDFKT
jgi:hypothetical protein